MMLRTSLGLLGALTLTASPVMAQERKVEVTPYLGVDQTVLVPLKGGGDVLTYTNVTAGLTAQLQTRRVEAVADVQYNHSFGWGREASDQDVISGIVSGQYLVSHGLTLNAGALATRIRTDGLSGAVFGLGKIAGLKGSQDAAGGLFGLAVEADSGRIGARRRPR